MRCVKVKKKNIKVTVLPIQKHQRHEAEKKEWTGPGHMNVLFMYCIIS